ncbi:DUF6193 family natural product biosynthesis protein [Streptomyces xinghaiensis]|uniref:DUF6193 family natural product biosynthesis protein n=1 Tax=Streptomyces xinghaiensis TaxID=1038928 RepID=UPI0012FFB488|nr:DUF6193 family natural product biosynthesis protein [Streptomyces xinghaiensis]MZE78155.1 hypothetical protein [Streptomyces sp. SID5475]
MDALDSGLYPDLFAAGGLISTMELVSEEKNLDLGQLYSHYASGPGLLTTAELDSSRGRASVQLGSQSRTFYVAIQGQGFTWAEGATDDLDDLIEALAAWRDGISVDDFAGRFPFMMPGRLARTHESGDSVSAQWKWLRTAEEFSEERPLVEAAYADGRFGYFFPTLSHGTLRLRSMRRQREAQEVSITPLSGGSYRVENPRLLDPTVVDSLREALNVASEALTSNE